MVETILQSFIFRLTVRKLIQTNSSQSAKTDTEISSHFGNKTRNTMTSNAFRGSGRNYFSYELRREQFSKGTVVEL